jgi:hypothetical protein
MKAVNSMWLLSTNAVFRFQIMRNIGNAFIALGKINDAIQAFETIMESTPDYRSGIIFYQAKSILLKEK